MNLRSLQIFQMVCSEGSITKAAKQLYMTQPAISHAIHDLESELQVQLFDRYGKRIYLNETGKTFLMHVKRVLLSYDELMQHIPLLEEEATIRIGSSITIANDHLPNVLKNFKAKYPNTSVQVHVESAANVTKRLLHHDIDIALLEGVVVRDDLKKVHFSSYELQVVCSGEHPLSRKDTIQWEEIPLQDWLLREKGSAVRDTFDSACRLQQIIIEPIWTSVNSQALLQAVRSNLGVTVLPDFVINSCPFKKELHLLRIEGSSLYNDNHIVYDHGLFLSEPMKALLAMLKE